MKPLSAVGYWFPWRMDEVFCTCQLGCNKQLWSPAVGLVID